MFYYLHLFDFNSMKILFEQGGVHFAVPQTVWSSI